MTNTTQGQEGREVQVAEFPAGITIDLLEALSTVPRYWQYKSFDFAHRGTEKAIVFWLTNGTREATFLVDEKGTWAAFKAFISKDLPRNAHTSIIAQLATRHPDLDLTLEPAADQDPAAGIEPAQELFTYADLDLGSFLASPHACLDTLFSECDEVERQLKEF